MKDDTICAISTPQGSGGISIVRLSGESAFEIAKKVFKPKNEKIDLLSQNRKLIYGNIMSENDVIDEVMVSFMKKPYTYTREDIVEINCHGSLVAVKEILHLLIKNGARLADAGEFTKRAFLNGRIDLTQAEAVIDLINATGEISKRQALGQLKGTLKNSLKSLQDNLIDILAKIEYSINFTEDGEDLDNADILKDLNIACDKIKKLVDSSKYGRVLKDGINTAIIGKPNVGKSSLLNTLLKEERAIVTDIPGTTRDLITEYINIGDVTLKINDTAGIRETDDLVEKIGVDISIGLIEKSDLIIAIFDSSKNMSEEDYKILKLIEGKNAIVLLNKTDLSFAIDESIFENIPTIKMSIKNETGIDKLVEKISEKFSLNEITYESVVISNLRHEHLLKEAYEMLINAKKDLTADIPLDCVEVDIRRSFDNLSEIMGEDISDEILEKVFKEFCVGK